MAYKLKTTGIAAHCTMCIAVDPDTGTIKDFASSAVTADLLVGANVTIGTQDWDGNTRHYWQPGAGTADADFVLFGANKPAWTFTTGGLKRAIVFIGEVAGSQARVFGQNSSAYLASQDTGSGGATYPTMYGHGWSTRCTGGLTAVSSGQKIIFGFSAEHGSFSTAYAALHDAASMTVVTGLNAPNATSGSQNYDISALNRRNDSTAHQQDKTHAILVFDVALTESEWDSLRDDWFSVLFEVDGGGPVEGDLAATESGSDTAEIVGPATITGTLAVTESGSDAAALAGEAYGLIQVPYPLDNGTNTPLANLTDLSVFVHDPATGTLVVKKTGLSTDASAFVEDIKDAAIQPVTSYRLVFRDEDGVEGENEGMDTLTSS